MSFQIYELNINKPSHLIYKGPVLNKGGNIIEPILELYKGKLFTFLIKFFITDCIETFGPKIFSIKKSHSRTITNLLSSWIFNLYIDYNYSSDFFLPTNYNNTKSLENILRDLCKYDSSIIDVDNKVYKITYKLKKNYKYQLNLLKEYNNSSNYKLNKNNYKIHKTIVSLKKNKYSNQEILFYKFEIIIPFQIKDKRLLNVLNNILIPIKNYNKLVDKYSGPPNKIDEIIWGIIYRYQLLGSNNHQLAILPDIMFKMHQDFYLNFECFASSINSTFSNYCSIYWDLEQFFGSVGNFFNITPIKGTFGFNPPFQKEIIEIGINKIFKSLNDTKYELSFIITIPVWDSYGQNIMKETFNNQYEKQNIDYGDFEIINDIKKSKFLKKIRMIPKEEFTYIDHNFELYKNKTIQNTYVIILSNCNINFNIIDEYIFENNLDN